MVKQLYNKGYTFIEVIFVLAIISIMSLISLNSLPDTSNLQFRYLISLIKKEHVDSLINHDRNTMEIYDSTVYINDKQISIYPLTCDPIYFHFNSKGNISRACTIRCYSKNKDYEIKLQLGSGWLTIEK